MADVFISYSRKDVGLVRRLHQELVRLGRDTWVDWEDIPPTAEWLAEVRRAIEAADTCVVVISPESLASKICNDELAHAVAHNKRLVPVVSREVTGGDIPQALSKLNWIFARQEDDFDQVFRSLLTAIDTDLEWVRTHTRLDVRSNEWERKGRDSSFLLRGTDLKDAEQWLQEAGRRQERNPTPLQTEYILASRHKTISRQRIVLSAVTAALVVAVALALLAFAEYRISEKRRRTSLSQKLAAQAVTHLEDQLDLACLLSVEAYRVSETVEARSALLQVLQHAPYIEGFLSGHAEPGVHLTFSPDGKTLASSSWDGEVILWDRATRQRLDPPFPTDKRASINCLIFSPDGKALASASDTKIVLWDVASREPKGPPLTYSNVTGFYSIAFTADGKLLASGDSPTGRHRPTIVLWDVGEGKPLGKPIVGYRFAVSAQGSTLAFGSDDDNSVMLVDIATRNTVAKLSGHGRPVQCLVFSPKGEMLASGSEDNNVIVWDVAAAEPLFAQPLASHKSVVNSVAFSPDNRMLASGSGDKTIILWNLATGERIGQPLAGSAEPVYQVAFSPDGQTLASCGGNDSRIILWDLKRRHSLGLGLVGAEVRDSDVIFSPDGKYLAAADGSTILLLDAASGDWVGAPLRGQGHQVLSLAFSPDGQSLASGDFRGKIVLWDVRNRVPHSSRLAVDAPVFSMAFSPDGKLLAAGSYGMIELWDVATQQPICPPLTNHADQIWGLDFSPDGRMLASCGTKDGSVVLWDVASRLPIGTRLSPPSSRKNIGWSKVCVRFSPDGKKLASTNPAENSIVLWDVATRRPAGTPLASHKYQVLSLAFSPNGQFLASGSYDDSVILWDVASHQPIGKPFEAHTNGVYSVAFSPDGKILASSGEDNQIVLWKVSVDSWRSRACSRANRNLKREEWDRYLGGEAYRKTCPNLP